MHTTVLCGTQCEEFEYLLILDLSGIRFHAVAAFGLSKDFLLNLCEKSSPFIWGIIFFCTMDVFSRILEKKLSELLCTRLYNNNVDSYEK